MIGTHKYRNVHTDILQLLTDQKEQVGILLNPIGRTKLINGAVKFPASTHARTRDRLSPILILFIPLATKMMKSEA